MALITSGRSSDALRFPYLLSKRNWRTRSGGRTRSRALSSFARMASDARLATSQPSESDSITGAITIRFGFACGDGPTLAQNRAMLTRAERTEPPLVVAVVSG